MLPVDANMETFVPNYHSTETFAPNFHSTEKEDDTFVPNFRSRERADETFAPTYHSTEREPNHEPTGNSLLDDLVDEIGKDTTPVPGPSNQVIAPRQRFETSFDR